MKKTLSILLVIILMTMGLCGCTSSYNSSATGDESSIDESSTIDVSNTAVANGDTTTSTVESSSESSTTVPDTTANKTEPTKANTDRDDDKESNTNKTVSVSDVSLSKSSISIYVGNSDSLTVSLSPSNATDRTYTASASNSNAAVYCSGNTVTVTGQYEGSCTVTVTSSNGKSATCKVTVSKKPTPVITDDTPLPHDELMTVENVYRLAQEVTDYYKGLGMIEDTSLSTNTCGWFFVYDGSDDVTAVRSYNQQKSRDFEYIELQVNRYLINGDMEMYQRISFHCYPELKSDGEYAIYFCYR